MERRDTFLNVKSFSRSSLLFNEGYNSSSPPPTVSLILPRRLHNALVRNPSLVPKNDGYNSSAPPPTASLILPRRLHNSLVRNPSLVPKYISLDGLDLNRFCGPLFTECAFGVKQSSCPSRGRGMLKRTVITDECICDRPRVKIICQVCGFLTEGRVRIECPMHKHTIFLMDMEACGRCKAISNFLHELHVCLKDSNNNNQK